MKKVATILFHLALLMNAAFGQEILDLRQCITIAQAKNISLKQAALSLENGKLQVSQNKANRLPNLNASAGHTYNFGRSIDPFTNQFNNQSIQSNNFSLSSGVILFNGFQIQNSIKQSEQALAVNSKDLEVLNNNISLSVSSLYLQILLNEELLNNFVLQKSLTAAQLERANSMFAAGNVSKSSVVNLEAQLASDDNLIVSAKNSIRNSYAQLAALIQMDDYNAYRIAKPELPKNTDDKMASLNEIIQKAQTLMPEIEREKLRLEQALTGIEIAKGAYYPRLSMFANLNTVYSESRKERYDIENTFIPVGFVEGSNERVLSPISTYKLKTTAFGQQLSDNFGQSIGLSLSVPIFNNYRVKNNVELGQIAYRQNQFTLENTALTLKNDIITAYANYENAVAALKSAQENTIAQQLNYDFTSDRFEAGLLNSVELLNAKNQWNTAQTNLTRARYEHIFRKLILDFYQGLPLRIE
jgi:outer membrane protein